MLLVIVVENSSLEVPPSQKHIPAFRLSNVTAFIN